MRNDIETLKKSIARAEEFNEKYGPRLADCNRTHLCVSDARVSVYSTLTDAAILGEVFGKHSWRRELAYSGRMFDWKREVDGVEITISDAEDCSMNGSPVPEKAFPIMIKEESDQEGGK